MTYLPPVDSPQSRVLSTAPDPGTPGSQTQPGSGFSGAEKITGDPQKSEASNPRRRRLRFESLADKRPFHQALESVICEAWQHIPSDIRDNSLKGIPPTYTP
ncbi:hypothetical protein CDAR_229671 [Caerostris darwini]|uniref:Uncharacterized protein n=1 Tax=Caerostris darwini TaxID=1538125 RepID=A0AAV4PY89_9ARAC|nr:hypothetical protein CDAR_229671 [Caerostris darwini]